MWRDNVKTAFYGMQLVLPHFKERGTGQIVNVSSGLGRMPTLPFRSAYSAAKHALNALSACLRMELKPKFPGIVVSVVMPGPVATDFGSSALGGGPDSRSLPNVQSAEDAAAVIAEVIETPRAEAYTAPQMQAEVEAYYHDVPKAEDAMAARFRR
jgi:short-subunit dehydrogenase